ncbi:MAG: cysteine desulfurase family protein [Candidatus Paceibacterota bacterium]
MFKKRIYLDYASLTPIDEGVLRTMKQYSDPMYANPSSWYSEGVLAKEALVTARKTVAEYLHAHPDDITFTSGGTESNNLALLGSIERLRNTGLEYDSMHVLISAIEHSSVRECANHLSEKGVRVEVIRVNSDGAVDFDSLKKQIRPDTVLISVMTVNNEIGTVEPIREIAKMVRQAREKYAETSAFAYQDVKYPLLHTDAAQGLYQDLNVEKLGVDMLTLDSSKVFGPRGIGALYKKRSLPISPVMYGGGQEKGLRSGTENLPGVMGFAEAVNIVSQTREAESVRLISLKKLFMNELLRINKDIKVNGERAKGDERDTNFDGAVSPHILNVSIPGIESEFFVMELDAHGIAASTKSSCLRDEDESYVLKTIGANSKNSVRFSFGRWSTEREVMKALKIIKELLGRIR